MKSIKKFISLILLCAVIAAIAIGCNTDNGGEAEPDERTVTVTDMSGDTVTITGEVKKIVNLWPAGTSSFFVMGAGDLIAGLAVNNPGTMNSWTQLFYPECVDIPALGGVTPSIEDIIKLEPDLVIIHTTTAQYGFAQQIPKSAYPPSTSISATMKP